MPATKTKSYKKAPVQRIVSLAPSVTSILLALGAERELVGVSKWCKDVAQVGKRPQVGDCWKLDVGDVMRLKPTVLIGSVPFSDKTVAQILQQPVAFLALNPRFLRDIEADIRILGQLVDRTREADRLIQKMRRGFNRVAATANKIRPRKPPKVYCEAWPNPRISSPLWVAEMVKIAGGKMIVKAGARVSDEEVAQAKPDVIVLAWTATNDRSKPEQALRNPRWQEAPAVRDRRVVVIRDELLNTPGPPLIDGVWQLLLAIHPELQNQVRGSRSF